MKQTGKPVNRYLNKLSLFDNCVKKLILRILRDSMRFELSSTPICESKNDRRKQDFLGKLFEILIFFRLPH